MTIILIASLIAMALVMLLLSVKLILKKDGRFPSSHVSSQKALRDKGISCHTSQHRETQQKLNLAERLALRDE